MPSEAGDERAPGPLGPTDNVEKVLGDERPKGEKDKKKSIKPDHEPFEAWEREEMEKLLGMLRGHLGEILHSYNSQYVAVSLTHRSVVYPTQFLEEEDIANNFLSNADKLLPLPIYN